MMRQEKITPTKFLDLSAALAYRLSGQAFDPRTVLDLILDGQPLPSDVQKILLQGIKVIQTGYGDMHRKMGPLAVIHPLRAAAILCRIAGVSDVTSKLYSPVNTGLLGLLSTLLHDTGEDLTEKEIGPDRVQATLAEIRTLNKMLIPDMQRMLADRIHLLTIQSGQDYTDYLVNIMSNSQEMPDLIRTKLSDRIDNTLDVRVTTHNVAGQGTFGTIFDLLFLPTFKGLEAPNNYVPLAPSESTQILANLFKNVEFVSLLRTEGCHVDSTSEKLRDGLLRKP